MSRLRRHGPALAAVALITAAGIWLIGEEGPGTSSALSADARGWLAVRRYLEGRGAEVRLRDEPLGGSREPSRIPGGVLVLAFPWQRLVTGDELEGLGRHLLHGGTVVLAYSRRIEQSQESLTLIRLGLETVDVRPEPSLAPWSWWRYQREVWTLEPEWESDGPRLTVPAFRRAPDPPARATVLYRAGRDRRPVVFAYPLNRGRVVVMPADLLANAFLSHSENADFLETLHGWLGPRWTFDEYHHGLTAAELTADTIGQFAWDLFFVHLALLYVLGLVALARRFGPPWRENAVTAGSAASFLRSLGELHRHLGHHREAARLLELRVRQLDGVAPAGAGAGSGDDRPTAGSATGVEVTGDDTFREYARRVSLVQRRRNR